MCVRPRTRGCYSYAVLNRATGSDHYVQVRQPDTVIAAIRLVIGRAVAQSRAGRLELEYQMASVRSSGGKAAIDSDRRAGNVAGFVTGEVGNGGGDVVDAAVATEGGNPP